MSAENLTVGGRRFRTQADYAAALRDQKKIDTIRSRMDLDDPGQLKQLYKELQSGAYRFETPVGNDFDDEIYEKIEALKKRGVTEENAGKPVKGQTGRPKKTERKPGAKASGKPAGTGPAKDLTEYDKDMQKQILGELKKRERRRRLIVGLASLVAVACFGYFGIYYFYSVRTSMDYEQLASLKGSDVLAVNQVQKPNEFSLHKSALKLPDVLDEYKTLYEKNKKLIGWLKIDDTNIDYPVMQTVNNEYYLDHNFNQEYDKNGSLFLDKDCDVVQRNTNLIIYGHHMKSGKMFGGLNKYSSEEYARKHSEIQFDTIYKKGTYEVMYVFRSKIYNEEDVVFKYYKFLDAASEKEFDSNMQEMEALSLYDTGVKASYGDELLTLSTCDNSETDGRFVVVAKRVKEEN